MESHISVLGSAISEPQRESTEIEVIGNDWSNNNKVIFESISPDRLLNSNTVEIEVKK